VRPLTVCALVCALSSSAHANERVPAPEAALRVSISCGHANRGALFNARRSADEGTGYVVPEPWRSRSLRYGTQELIALLERVAARVAEEHPGAVLGIGDLSREFGGACPRHRSHQSGRDADLLYYAAHADGSQFPHDEHMPYYTRRGRAYYARSPEWTPRIPERYFDVARNWALVKALITDDEVVVERLFVSPRIERWLIEHARAEAEDPELIRRAQIAMHSPRNAQLHNDHMHIRIGCSDTDTVYGRCQSEPARRTRRKHHARVRCPR